MTLTPEQVAENLLGQCLGDRKNAAEVADRKARETFLLMPHASIIWREACKILEQET